MLKKYNALNDYIENDLVLMRKDEVAYWNIHLRELQRKNLELRKINDRLWNLLVCLSSVAGGIIIALICYIQYITTLT